jgi:hypothetical protein
VKQKEIKEKIVQVVILITGVSPKKRFRFKEHLVIIQAEKILETIFNTRPRIREGSTIAKVARNLGKRIED